MDFSYGSYGRMSTKGDTKLHTLVKELDLQRIKHFHCKKPLKFLEQLHSTNVCRQTPFIVAVDYDEWEIVEFFVQVDPSVCAHRDSLVGGAINIGIERNYEPSQIEKLLSYGCKVEDQHATLKCSAVVRSVQRKLHDVTKVLMQHGASSPNFVVTTDPWFQDCTQDMCIFTKFGPCFVLAVGSWAQCILDVHLLGLCRLLYHEGGGPNTVLSHFRFMCSCSVCQRVLQENRILSCSGKMELGPTSDGNMFIKGFLPYFSKRNKVYFNDNCHKIHTQAEVEKFKTQNPIMKDVVITFCQDISPSPLVLLSKQTVLAQICNQDHVFDLGLPQILTSYLLSQE
jgi:hypothetical protein